MSGTLFVVAENFGFLVVGPCPAAGLGLCGEGPWDPLLRRTHGKNVVSKCVPFHSTSAYVPFHSTLPPLCVIL